jgi:hypothetical protein
MNKFVSIDKDVNQSYENSIHFHRTELSPIISLYGRIYTIEKRPKLKSKQGMYSVVGMDGHILKRGSDLKAVLQVLERKLIKLVK